MQKIIEELLGKLFKMSSEEIAEILKKSDGTEGIDEEKVLKIILDKDKDRIAKIKGEGPKWDDAMKKATREVWSKVEKELKEKFDIESDLQGDELIDFVANDSKEKLGKAAEAGEGKKPAEMTEDEIKKTPVYIKAEKAFKKSLEEKDADKDKSLKELQDSFTQKENFSKVRNAALSKFRKIENVILPSDAEKAQKMIDRLLLDQLAPYDYQIDDNGKFLILYKDGDKKGKRVEDAHGNAMEFDDLIEGITKSNFELKVSTDRKSPGNGKDKNNDAGGDETKKKKYTGKAPGSKQDYLALLTSNDLSSEQKLEVKSTYGEEFSK